MVPGLVMALTMTLGTGCGPEDPLAARLAQRLAHQVEVQSFNERDDGTLLVEVRVTSSVGPVLEALTVTLRQHDAGQEVLRQDRVTLDLSGMDRTGVVHLFATVPSAGAATESLSAVV
ncbi:MAG: hypothetical protein ACE5IK_01845, partial [Acidobacteriota bacterium]